jgi:SAM-dependent methyltransferase
MNFLIMIFARVRSFLVEHFYVKRLINAIDKTDLILEIGGGYNPRFYKNVYRNAYHLDHYNTEMLKAKYITDSNVAHLVHQIQNIDFIFDGSPIETLIPQTLRFDYIYSSHALEHQVDIVGHLRSIEQILKSDGKVILVIPDHRACFDRLRFPTVTSDAMAVYLRNQSTHQGKQVFESLAQSITKNPGRRVNRFDLSTDVFCSPLEMAYHAVCASEIDTTKYCDVHAWTFTPLSFQLLMVELFILEMTSLRLEMLSPSYGNQFCAILYKCPEKEKESQKKIYTCERFRLSRRLYS